MEMKIIGLETPTPQTEVVKIVVCNEEYTRLKGKAIYDDCSEDRYVFTKSMQFGAIFLMAKNLNHRTKAFNLHKINTIEDGFKRVFVVYKTNNTHYSDYQIREYFIPNVYDFRIVNNDRHIYKKCKDYEIYSGEDVELICEHHNFPKEFNKGTEISLEDKVIC